MRDRLHRLTENLHHAIVGKDHAIQLVLVGLLSGGHVLLEDVPGVGKTLLAKSLAKSIDGIFQRLQCTPDLMPTDVTGTNIWNPKRGDFEFLSGPVFAHVLLVDEINRATPRTQAALLEVMEEHQVTTDGVSRSVPTPFFTIATQNPVEYQGTFPLPEAQMDRFALSLSLGYPDEQEELQMIQRLQSSTKVTEIEPCITPLEIQELQKACREIRVEPELQDYILRLVRSTREDSEITLGSSPRGTVAMVRSIQAYAYIQGRDYAIPDDVKFLAPYVLAHRLIPTSGRQARSIIDRLLTQVPVTAK